MEDKEYYLKQKEKAKQVFEKANSTYCPYFDKEIVFNADGFHHLMFLPNRRERSHKAQLLKFSLLPLAVDVVRKSGTVQEFEKIWVSVGKSSRKDGMRKTKEADYWGLYAIVGGRKRIRIRVILRKLGDGNLTFWSVMPNMNIRRQKLNDKGLTTE